MSDTPSSCHIYWRDEYGYWDIHHDYVTEFSAYESLRCKRCIKHKRQARKLNVNLWGW